MSDLISRSELKKAIKNLYDETLDGIVKFGIEKAYKEIDNAPSVFSCNACKNMGNEWECVDCHDYSNYVHYDERLQGDCEKCDFRKFTETFIDGVVDVMNRNGITSVEQLSEILKGGAV